MILFRNNRGEPPPSLQSKALSVPSIPSGTEPGQGCSISSFRWTRPALAQLSTVLPRGCGCHAASACAASPNKRAPFSMVQHRIMSWKGLTGSFRPLLLLSRLSKDPQLAHGYPAAGGGFVEQAQKRKMMGSKSRQAWQCLLLRYNQAARVHDSQRSE